MLRKTMSIALAISMFAVAFAALAVHAQTLDSQIMPYDNAGNVKKVFFTGDTVYFQVEYKVDGVLSSTQFQVSLTTVGGNLVDGTRLITTNNPSRGLYNSWLPNVHFHLGGSPAGTYILKAVFVNTSVVLCTNTITVKTNGVVLTPDQTAYAPGQSVRIDVTANWNFPAFNNLINITIGKANVTWVNQTLTDFSWNGTWDIPLNLTTGLYPIYVNSSHDNTPLGVLPNDGVWGFPAKAHIDVEYFMVSVSTDKAVYLPGEQMVVSYLARSVPDNAIIPIALDWEMEFMDAVTGHLMWQNTTQSASPFNVTLPSLANIGADILVNVTAHASYNHTANFFMFVRLGTLGANINTDKTDYAPGEKMVVTAQAMVTDIFTSPVAGASIAVSIYDDVGNLVTSLNLTGLVTDSAGNARGVITLPSTIEVKDDYLLVAKVTKFAFSAVDSATFNVRDVWVMKVLYNKDTYVSGESINVDFKVWRNGVATTPASIEYWLTVGGYAMPHKNTTLMAVAIIAPAINQPANGVVHMVATVDGKIMPETDSTPAFTITPLIINLGASKINYYGGDSIDFMTEVTGTSVGFTITYSIWDNENTPVQNGTLTLDTSGKAKFTLAIPKETPSSSYTARVVADNGLGVVSSPTVTVSWLTDYLLNADITTGPSATTGTYAPGTTITVHFDITKMSTELPDLTVVTATVTLWQGGYPIITAVMATGETNTFSNMQGDLNILLPKELANGPYTVQVQAGGLVAWHVLTVSNNEAGWSSSVGGMSASDLLLTILVVIVILMLLFMMMKRGGMGAAAGASAAPKPEAPKEAKQDTYAPKSSVKCPSCGNMVEVATSKRPIEVMCPKCGTSQIVN